MLRGLAQVLPAEDIVTIVNTGDDEMIHGLHVSPDLDTVMYTLAGLADDQRGWGLAGETWNVMEYLEELGGETWFRLGDKDLATHLYRTGRLSQGAPLSQVTAELAARLGVPARLLPMTDDEVRTRVRLSSGEEVSFQHYFVRLSHDVAISAVRFHGIDEARPAPGVMEALAHAGAVIICPSNPVVSIGPILAIEGVRAFLADHRGRVVAVSPLIAGKALKGPADRMLVELGGEASVVEVARTYADVAGTLVIDETDREQADLVEGAGCRAVVARAVMHDLRSAELLARAVLDAAGYAYSTPGPR
jgi:LPPG:FO 2-phospho-L-lactate transferase